MKKLFGILILSLLWNTNAFSKVKVASKNSDQIIFKDHSIVLPTWGSLEKKVNNYLMPHAKNHCGTYKKNAYIFYKIVNQQPILSIRNKVGLKVYDGYYGYLNLANYVRFICAKNLEEAYNDFSKYDNASDICHDKNSSMIARGRYTYCTPFFDYQMSRDLRFLEAGIGISDNTITNTKVAFQLIKRESEREERRRVAEEKKAKKLEAERIRKAKIKAKIEEAKRLKRIAIERKKKYGPLCKDSFFRKGYKENTKEWNACLIRQEQVAKKIEQANKKFEKEQAILKERKKIKEVKKKPVKVIEKKPIQKVIKTPEVNPSLITIGSGSGFYINRQGYALTNNHVVSICRQNVSIVDGKEILFRVIGTDKTNDIAIIKADIRPFNYIKINTDGAKLGENIVAVGYPLAGRLSDSVKITKGIVSSLTGLNNNIGQIQIDAALQPGNSGGPVLNEDGVLVGMASAGLNKLLMAKEAKYIPENVNFAVASPIIVNVLKNKKIKYSSPSFFSGKYTTTELAEIGNKSTIQLFCRNTKEAYAKLKESEKYSQILLDLE